MGTLIVAAAALFIAFCGLLATIVGLRRKTDDTYTTQLEGRIGLLEDDNAALTKRLAKAEDALEECKRGRQEIRDMNFDLLMENRRLKGAS